MQNLRARGQSPRFHENTIARRAEEEGLCRADHSVQSSMGAFGFYPLIVLDDDVQVSAFMRCG